MTPQNAKPTGMVDEQGNLTLWFTAKETAEIAKAYARAVLSRGDISSRCLNGSYEPETADKFEDIFKEWSK